MQEQTITIQIPPVREEINQIGRISRADLIGYYQGEEFISVEISPNIFVWVKEGSF